MDLLTLGIADARWSVSTDARGLVGAEVEAVVRPEAIRLSEPQRGFPGQVVSSSYLGSKIEYLVRLGDQMLKVVQSDPTFGARFAEGAEVEVTLPHVGVQLLGEAVHQSP